MKRVLALAAIACLAGAVATAQERGVRGPVSNTPRDNVGIGLGTLIFEGSDGLVQQVLAATTNGSCGNQTFAITSGTSGAKPWSRFVMNEEIHNFVRDNMDTLAREMARGSGETLDTLAELIGVEPDARPAFAKEAQANFNRIYSSASVTHVQVLENLEGQG
jgi:hypothetical protein